MAGDGGLFGAEAQGLQLLVDCLHVSYSVTLLPHRHPSVGVNGKRGRGWETGYGWVACEGYRGMFGEYREGAEVGNTHWAYVCPCKS